MSLWQSFGIGMAKTIGLAMYAISPALAAGCYALHSAKHPAPNYSLKRTAATACGILISVAATAAHLKR